FGIDHPAEPAIVRIDGAVMAGENRLATQPHALDRAERQAEGKAVAEPDDFAGEVGAAGCFYGDPASDAQLAHRPGDLDQKSLHGLYATEDFDLIDRFNV